MIVRRVVASLLCFAFLSSPALAVFQPGGGGECYVNLDDIQTDNAEVDGILRRVINKNGKVDYDALNDALANENGEVYTFWPVVIAAVAAVAKASCENDWSYRDKDRCVGKCDDRPREKKRGGQADK